MEPDSPLRRPDTEKDPMHQPLVIDCDDCVMRRTSACDDCVVTFVCSREPDEALVIDAAEERAIRLLSEGGLVPQLRHRPATDRQTG